MRTNDRTLAAEVLRVLAVAALVIVWLWGDRLIRTDGWAVAFPVIILHLLAAGAVMLIWRSTKHPGPEGDRALGGAAVTAGIDAALVLVVMVGASVIEFAIREPPPAPANLRRLGAVFWHGCAFAVLGLLGTLGFLRRRSA